MNNIHDMGGLQGFGPVAPETDEPVFHNDWEAKAMALTLAMGAWGRWNIDASRHARERLGPLEYLRFTYYERWLAGLADLMVERGLITDDELASGRADQGSTAATPPLKAAGVADMLRKGGPSARAIEDAPRFKVGDRVRTVKDITAGHTRLPAYARGREGEVVLAHGGHVLPDSNAHFQGEAPEHLYGVRFTAHELWGKSASAKDSVTLDLWESYLEPA